MVGRWEEVGCFQGEDLVLFFSDAVVADVFSVDYPVEPAGFPAGDAQGLEGVCRLLDCGTGVLEPVIEEPGLFVLLHRGIYFKG